MIIFIRQNGRKTQQKEKNTVITKIHRYTKLANCPPSKFSPFPNKLLSSCPAPPPPGYAYMYASVHIHNRNGLLTCQAPSIHYHPSDSHDVYCSTGKQKDNTGSSFIRHPYIVLRNQGRTTTQPLQRTICKYTNLHESTPILVIYHHCARLGLNVPTFSCRHRK